MIQCFNDYEDLKDEADNCMLKFSKVNTNFYRILDFVNFYNVKKQLHFCP